MQFDDQYLDEQYGDDIATYPTQTQPRRIPGMYPPRPQETDYDDPYIRKTEALSKGVPPRASSLSRSRVTSAATRPERTQARRTGDDPAIGKLQPIQKGWTRRRALNAALYGGSSLIGGATLALVGKGALDRNAEDVQEGRARADVQPLVCGHHDSPAHPTLLICFMEKTGDLYTHVHFLEYPGGDPTHLQRLLPYRSDDLRSKYEDSELGCVDLKMTPMLADGGKYQILLTLTLSAKLWPPLSRPAVVHILFVDRGHGYFEPVEPAKGGAQ